MPCGIRSVPSSTLWRSFFDCRLSRSSAFSRLIQSWTLQAQPTPLASLSLLPCPTLAPVYYETHVYVYNLELINEVAAFGSSGISIFHATRERKGPGLYWGMGIGGTTVRVSRVQK